MMNNISLAFKDLVIFVLKNRRRIGVHIFSLFQSSGQIVNIIFIFLCKTIHDDLVISFMTGVYFVDFNEVFLIED